jgi:hypothetical protein
MRSGFDAHATCFSHQLPHLLGLDSGQLADLLEARRLEIIELFEPAPLVIQGDLEDAQHKVRRDLHRVTSLALCDIPRLRRECIPQPMG